MAKSGKQRRRSAARQAGQRVRPVQRPVQSDAGAPRRLVLGGAILALALIVAGAILVARRDDPATDGGPAAIARLDAADIHSLAIDPANADHVYFGSHAGIEESRDGGFTWDDGALRDADAMGLAVSPNAPQTLYATGHDVFVVSRDGGATWEQVSHNLPGTDIHAFAQDPADPQRLFAFVAGNGVLTSADGGTSWTTLGAQPPGGSPTALASNGDVLFAGTADGLWLSRDQGATWSAAPGQPPGGAIALVAPPSDPNLLYAGTPNGLAKSGDGGQTWSLQGPTGTPVLALAVSADAGRVVFVRQDGGVYRSDDGGLTWLPPR